MNALNIEHIIVLLILNKNKNFQNSYSLTKILSWKFNIIDVMGITNNLANDGLIVSEIRQSINFHIPTKKGITYLEKYLDESKNLLFAQYPQEIEYLHLLIN